MSINLKSSYHERHRYYRTMLLGLLEAYQGSMMDAHLSWEYGVIRGSIRSYEDPSNLWDKSWIEMDNL